MSTGSDENLLTMIGGTIFILGAFLFASGSCTYLASWLALNAEGLSGIFLMLLSLPVKLFSLPAALYQAIIAAVFGLPFPNFAMPGGFTPFSEAVLYIWYLPILGAVLYVLGKNAWHQKYLVPVIAVLFPRSVVGQTRRSKKEADIFRQETTRSDLSAELDETLAELERTKHKIRQTKQRRG